MAGPGVLISSRTASDVKRSAAFIMSRRSTRLAIGAPWRQRALRREAVRADRPALMVKARAHEILRLGRLFRFSRRQVTVTSQRAANLERGGAGLQLLCLSVVASHSQQ